MQKVQPTKDGPPLHSVIDSREVSTNNISQLRSQTAVVVKYHEVFVAINIL